MKYFLSIVIRLFFWESLCDSQNLWQGVGRTVRYQSEGTEITISNDWRRYTRGLYRTNSAFRAEAGVLPELDRYMTGISGNNYFGLGTESIPIIDRDKFS